ncbi:MAG: pentapeptide repeat-containing protein [Saprospiraceae bacterium]|nr:pentapeptide repeat-containing protein [Saprospiraceae bacterium]
MGFLKVPYIKAQNEFWLGIGLTLFIIILVSFIFPNLIFKILKINSDSDNCRINYKNNWYLISIIILIIYIIFLQIKEINGSLKLNSEYSNNIAWNRSFVKDDQKNKFALLSSLISVLDKSKPNNDTLKKFIKEQILAISSSLHVYNTKELDYNDSISLSVEKGILLQALLHCEFDSTDFSVLKNNISFDGANLENADLRKFDLSGINLNRANLQNANLEFTKFNNAQISGSNFRGANLRGASFIKANLIKAKMNWVNLIDGNLQYANLDSTDLTNSQFINADFSNAIIIYANLANAIFDKANLLECLVVSCDLKNTRFNKAYLVNSKISHSYIALAEFDSAIVGKNWMDQITEYGDKGVNEIKTKYNIDCYNHSNVDSINCTLIKIK